MHDPEQPLTTNEYAWCYWPDRSAWLTQIRDGKASRVASVAIVERDACGYWTWRVMRSYFHPEIIGTEPTRMMAIERATEEAMRAVPLPAYHAVMYRPVTMSG